MKYFVLIASLGLVTLLSACGTTPQNAQLTAANVVDTPIVVDSEVVAAGLEAAGFGVIIAESDTLAKTFETTKGGLLSYTPLPDDVPTIDPEWFKKLFEVPWCDPRLCDPPEPIIVWEFSGLYMTQKLVDTLTRHDISAYQLVGLAGPELAEVLAQFDIRITYRSCDGLTGECVDIEVPPVKVDPPCPVCEKADRYFELATHWTSDLEQADLVIADSRSLPGAEAALGKFIQVHGEGLEPVLESLNFAVHAEVGEEAASALTESLLSTETQLVLYEKAGLLPVAQEALERVAEGTLGEHIEGALEFGEFASIGPLPHPF